MKLEMDDIFKYLKENIKFTISEIKEIKFCFDILSHKKNISFEKISLDLNGIAFLNLPYKLKKQKIKKYLKKLCYPALSYQDEKFRKISKELENKIKNIKFIQPSNFEKNEINIIIKCKKPEEIEDCLEEIKRYKNKLNQLLEIVKCENANV